MGGVMMENRIRDANKINQIIFSERKKIEVRGDLEDVSANELLVLFDQLCEFSLGRFLIVNKILDGYWTNEIVTWDSNNSRDMHPLEDLIYSQFPITLATRERYGIFCSVLQNLLKPGLKMASIPCGLMTDLLNLNKVDEVSLFGIDIDKKILKQAGELAKQRGVHTNTKLYEENAWDISHSEKFDVITSNGLNIYEPSDERVTELYQVFYNALKSGGRLVTSFMTPPPSLTNKSSWCMDLLDPRLLRLQKIIFTHVIGTKWNALRTEDITLKQLEDAGFKNIQIIYDRAGMFPTVLATKK